MSNVKTDSEYSQNIPTRTRTASVDGIDTGAPLCLQNESLSTQSPTSTGTGEGMPEWVQANLRLYRPKPNDPEIDSVAATMAWLADRNAHLERENKEVRSNFDFATRACQNWKATHDEQGKLLSEAREICMRRGEKIEQMEQEVAHVTTAVQAAVEKERENLAFYFDNGARELTALATLLRERSLANAEAKSSYPNTPLP